MTLKSIMEITASEWLKALRFPQGDVPDVVIVEGSSFREQRTKLRLSHLTDVRELNFPDIFWGRWNSNKIVYSCAYGAARTAEVVHLFSLLGAKLVVQVGSCGGLQKHLKPGDILLPSPAMCREGVAQLYGAYDTASPAPEALTRARDRLEARGHAVHIGMHLSWSTLFAQNGAMIEEWARAGYLGVDMETAATFAVARHFNCPAVSMLTVWGDLTSGKSYFDPPTNDEIAAQEKANTSIFEVALGLLQD